MLNLNYYSIAGRLGGDPKRFNSALSFGVANRQDYLDKDGALVEQTYWFNVSAYGKLADGLEKVLKKGYSVIVTGQLSSAKDDKGKTIVYLNARSVEITHRPADATSDDDKPAATPKANNRPQSNYSKSKSTTVTDDDPFADDDDDS